MIKDLFEKLESKQEKLYDERSNIDELYNKDSITLKEYNILKAKNDKQWNLYESSELIIIVVLMALVIIACCNLTLFVCMVVILWSDIKALSSILIACFKEFLEERKETKTFEVELKQKLKKLLEEKDGQPK